jgi:hypothetical protein
MAAVAAAVATLVAAHAVFTAPAVTRAQDKDDRLWWSGDLVAHLKAQRWEPPYFRDTVRAYPDGHHAGLAAAALKHPTTSLTLGGFTYRTSRPLIEAGREIFRTYHFGTHQFWDFRRAIDWSSGVTDPAEYASRYGVKRDAEGKFVGIVGIVEKDGQVVYGHSCALCHSNVDAAGTIVDGMPNHDYDIGLYYDALRPRIRDGDLVYLGDAALAVLGKQGRGRTDPTMDSWWAPVKPPSFFALRGMEHGLRSNGDTANLWLQCYRNLNNSYAVESPIMEALMAFLLSIEPPPNPRRRGEAEERGAAIFRSQGCDRCHAPPYYTTGRVIDWEVIRTDPDRIHNGWPKGYKVPSLLRVDLETLFLHDGSLTRLEDLFDPARLDPSFAPAGIPEARRKPGAGVPGHPFGLGLAPADRAALVAFLRTL